MAGIPQHIGLLITHLLSSLVKRFISLFTLWNKIFATLDTHPGALLGDTTPVQKALSFKRDLYKQQGTSLLDLDAFAAALSKAASNLRRNAYKQQGSTRLDLDAFAAELAKAGNSLVEAFKLDGEAETLDQAKKIFEDVLLCLQDDHPNRSTSLISLADILVLRFDQSGDALDLEQAVGYLQSATLLESSDPALPIKLDGARSKLAVTRKDSADHESHDVSEYKWSSYVLLDYCQQLLTNSTLNLARTARTPTSTPYSYSRTSIQLLKQLADPSNHGKPYYSTEKELDEYIQLLEEISRSLPTNDPMRATCIDGLATATFNRHLVTSHLSDIQKSIHYRLESLNKSPQDCPTRALYLHRLGVSLWRRYLLHGGEASDLDGAIRQFCEVAELNPQLVEGVSADIASPNDAPTPIRPSALANLARALILRFNSKNSSVDLDDSITHCRNALALLPQNDPLVPECVQVIEKALQLRFSQRSNPADIDDAVTYLQGYIELHPHHPSLGTFVASLGVALWTRFGSGKSMEDLDRSITYLSATTKTPSQGGADDTYVICLADALMDRFDVKGVSEDLETARKCLERVLVKSGKAHELGIVHLARCMLSQYDTSHATEEFDRLVAYVDSLLRRRSPVVFGDMEAVELLGILAGGYSYRFDFAGEIPILERLIEIREEILKLCPSTDSERAMFLSRLGDDLLSRFLRRAKVTDLDNCITLHETALRLCPSNRSTLAVIHERLGNALLTRFSSSSEQTTGLKDLDSAVLHHDMAVSIYPAGHESRGTALINASRSYLARFEKLAEPTDLDSAIVLLRESPHSNTQKGHLPFHLTQIGKAIHSRFLLQLDPSDLEFAINLLRAALAMCPPGHAARSSVLDHLSKALKSRIDHLSAMPQDIKEMEEAMSSLEMCFTHPDDPSRPGILTSKAEALISQKRRHISMEDIGQALSYSLEALKLQTQSHSSRVGSLLTLAKVLRHRFDSTKSIEDLNMAIRYRLEARDEIRPDHPFVSHILGLLGSDYLEKYELTQHPELSHQAIAFFEKGAQHPKAHVTDRLNVALLWALNAEKIIHPSRLRGYKKVLQLSDQIYHIRPTVATRRELALAKLSPFIPNAAASCAIAMGEIETAVEMLEQGRAVLLAQVGRYRVTLEDLRQANAKLASEFEAIGRQLEASAVSVQGSLVTQTTFDGKAEHYRQLRDRWDSLVEQIREIEGFGTFLKPTQFSILRQAAAKGPVIIINCNPTRVDVIIVQFIGAPVVVPLPRLTGRSLYQLCTDFSLALSLQVPRSREQSITKVLRRIWLDIVQPVVVQLTVMGVPLRSRIWWCPTGEVSSLPIHAAGPYRKGQPNLPDLFISSYTPTLSALLRSSRSPRTNPEISSSSQHLLILGQPDTPGQSKLPGVEEELRRVQEVVPKASLLLGKKGTHDAVMKGLERHSWIHFSCHGSPDANDPFRSSFHLYDKPLHLTDIIQANLPNAEFAMLSACHSAATDNVSPDEIIHLAAAMQFAGFRSVIGTMWAMADVDGPVVSEAIYKYLFRHGAAPDQDVKMDYTDAAEALNLATQVLRENGVPTSRWVNFVHIGS